MKSNPTSGTYNVKKPGEPLFEVLVTIFVFGFRLPGIASDIGRFEMQDFLLLFEEVDDLYRSNATRH
ncbi:MAG: hypothetical protein OXC54_12230 [Rhodospirillaceae bacterium]|nr:hypothetical protein [Rhodospirillaceae bacterium]